MAINRTCSWGNGWRPKPRILILDEPTRGIDVGAKAQFHELIRNFAEQGMAVLLISSDLPELLSLSDRVMVMRQGGIVGELSQTEASQAKVLEMALPDGQLFEGTPPHLQSIRARQIGRTIHA